MIRNRRALHTVYVGMFVAASLGLGVSAETETAILDQNSGRTTAQISTPPAPAESFPDYDVAAGEDFMVSSTPDHLVRGQAATGGDSGSTGMAGNTRWNAETYRSAAGRHLAGGILSESLTPAQVSVDDVASATEERSSVNMPVDLTLVPGAYSLAAVPNPTFENDSLTGRFHAVGPVGGTDAFQANPDDGFGFGAAQNAPPETDLASRLYTPLEGVGPSSDNLISLETAGWSLPAPPAGN